MTSPVPPASLKTVVGQQAIWAGPNKDFSIAAGIAEIDAAYRREKRLRPGEGLTGMQVMHTALLLQNARGRHISHQEAKSQILKLLA